MSRADEIDARAAQLREETESLEKERSRHAEAKDILHRWVRIGDTSYLRADEVSETSPDGPVIVRGPSVELAGIGCGGPSLSVNGRGSVCTMLSRLHAVDDFRSLVDSVRAEQDTVMFPDLTSTVTDVRYGSTGHGKASILGREYRTVSIGGMTWMAENLRYEGVAGSYVSDDGYRDRYGVLYTWLAANNVAAMAEGWHLPSKSEWDALANAVGGYAVAGTKLKAISGGTDDYGFSALPAGFYYNGNVGSDCYFWTSTEYSRYAAYYSYFSADAAMSLDFYYKDYGFSVRLVKDE